MKLKALSLATLAGMYSAGIYAAAIDSGWKQVELTAEQIKQRSELQSQKSKQFDALNPGHLKSSLNRVIKPKKAEDKFVPEAGLTGTHVYIIQLQDAPVATYMGGVNNIPATALGGNSQQGGHQKISSAAHSNKLFSNSIASRPEVSAYRNHLRAEQQNFVQEANKLGVPLVIQGEFTVTLNAVTATLSQDEAIALSKSNLVKKIQRSVMHELNTDVGPQLINADKVWSGENTINNTQYKGEGQIIGIIDTGVNTDHMSFKDIGDDGYDHTNPLGEGVYLGGCAEEEFADRCNDKLIGVYTWDVISDMYSAEVFQPGYPNHDPWNRVQVRPVFGEDYNGHGSHTASTAAGNVIAEAPLQLPTYDTLEALGATGEGKNTGLTRKVSGVAPHANIISYQACKAGGYGDPYVGCPTEATVASIEQAVLDGVDVINYSISGYGFPWDDAVEQAFYAAYAAGISVAASAGNGGFSDATNHNSPWLLNVAATHHGRSFKTEEKAFGAFEGGDTTAPVNMTGESITGGITGFLINAEDHGDKSCDTPFAADTFNANEIVLCERSDQPRMAKAENVKAAGAGGFVLYNKEPYGDFASLVTDVYPLPSIHIYQYQGQQVLDWMATGTGHKGTITSGHAYADINEDENNLIASFTSAKENATFDGTLTPSIAAPGVQIIAAWADDQPFTQSPSPMDWNVIDGTSMSSPHIAGALALIRQAQPEWSVSEVQSAAQMTATNNLDDGSGSDPFFRGGAGMVNVDAAVNAGLIMDETAENMLLANPQNGGNPTMLNLPALVNTACEIECTWMRTVTATKDGTWTVEGKANHDEVSINIEATPNKFSLKAGESKTIFVTANILDAVTNNSSPEYSYLFGDVTLVAEEENVPDSHWPVKLRFSRNDLPQILNVEAHRDSGQYTLKDLPVEYLSELNGTIYKAAEAPVETITLEQDSDSVSPYWDGDVERSKVVWLDVPAGSKRVFAEAIKTISSTAPQYMEGDLDILIGYDTNGNDGIDFQDETICWSYSATQLDFCSISEPMPGKYWVVFNNYRGAWGEEFEDATFEDTFEIAYGVVSNDEAENMTITTETEITASTQTVDVDIKWDISDWEQGDRLYSMIHLGTSANNTSNIGTIPLNLVRSHNDVQIQSSQNRAKAGDVIDVNLEVLANVTGNDRAFELHTELPEGVSLVEGSIMIDNIQYTSSSVEVVDNQIIVTGNQLNSSEWPRRYNMTTNETDPMCLNPLGGVNGYVDLQEVDASFQPYLGGDYNQNHTFAFRDFWGEEDHTFALFENEEYTPYRSITVSPHGYVQFDGGELFWADHFPMSSELLAFGGRPDTMIAPMLRGSQWDGMFFNTPLIPGDPWDTNPEAQGITVLYNDNPKAIIVEWDNARTQTPIDYNWETGETVWEDWGDSYDFQAYVNVEYQYGDNQHEIVMAYDNLKFVDTPPHPIGFAGKNDGSIGMYGFWGPRGTHGPDFGGIGHQFHYGDVSEVLKDDLVICYDYTGPEATTFNVSFKVQVNNDATGTNMDLVVTSHVEGVDPAQQTLSIDVPSTITLRSTYENMTLVEEGEINDLTVEFFDTKPSGTLISVEGEGIEATINDHTSGSKFDIKAVKDFFGTTEVTVKVADIDFPNDAASTTFMLDVTPVNDAPVSNIVTDITEIMDDETITLNGSTSIDPDGDSITFLWEGPGELSSTSEADITVSSLEAGVHTFTLTVSDEVTSNSSEVTISVLKTNEAPNITVETDSGETGEVVTLDASKSTDPDDDELTFEWSGPGSISNATSATTTVSGLSAGSHTFTLVVSDGELSSSTEVTVTVSEPEEKSDSGSMSYVVLLAGLALAFRRKLAVLNK